VLARILGDELERRGARVEYLRAVDKNFLPSPTSDAGPGDEWPPVKKKVLASDILVLASPTWSGSLSSVAQRVIERLNGLFSEEDEEGRPPAYNHVAGFAATGNSDGAKHVVSEMMKSLNEIGFTIPGQAWTFFNHGSAAGPALTDSDPEKLKRSRWMAAVAANNLVATAKALGANPISAPPKLDDF
jgi:multimeric flavodoxin WrbA